MDLLQLLPLVPLVYFAGAALNGFWPCAPKPVVTAIGVGAPAIGLGLALTCLWRYLSLWPQPIERVVYAWTAGDLAIDVAFLLDPLSAVMLFIVTFVGFWIHVYSVGYMGHEEGYRRYFSYLNLFMGAMLLLVLGNNYLVMFVGWEGVGLCSYLLIGFYYDQKFPPYAGRKAFIVNRVGDFAFLVGMFALFERLESLRYREIVGRLEGDPGIAEDPYVLGLSLAGFVALCFFVGAMGKSAQIPLHVWLPDAMAGPTPVSALIHAATMVTAGVYMVARTNAIYQLASGVSTFVAVIGALTAIFAASIGLAQNDIKKVLAYSTVSQLGYMFLAAGLGVYTAAVFHLATHAFFKALLFLGSGSVIHAMGGEQDMRKMGGLKKHLPITYWTFLIGGVAIAGIPPLAGFFSKDEILAAAAGRGHGYWALYAVGLFTAGLTAFYMFRAISLTFHGTFRGTHDQEHHLHESPPSMTVPLLVLAAGSLVAGFAGVPLVLEWLALPPFGADWIGRFLEPTIARIKGMPLQEPHLSHDLELVLMGLSVALAALAIALAWRTYSRPDAVDAAGRDPIEARAPGLWRLLANMWYVDEIYDRAIVRPLAWLARVLWKGVDVFLIDGAINTGAWLTELAGDLGRLTTTGNVRNYALYFFLGVVLLFLVLVV